MSGHADTIRELVTQYVPNGFQDEYGNQHEGPHQRDALAALAALEAELIQQAERIARLEGEVAGWRIKLAEALSEPLEPCGDFPSKLEWLAFWLDSMDTVLEIGGQPQGHDVQDDLRRWAKDWRRLLGSQLT